MDRTVKQVCSKEGPGCRRLGAHSSAAVFFLWLHGLTIRHTWHSLAINISRVWKFYWKQLPAGRENKQNPFLSLNQTAGIKRVWTSRLVFSSLEDRTEQTPWGGNASCLLFFPVASLHPYPCPPPRPVKWAAAMRASDLPPVSPTGSGTLGWRRGLTCPSCFQIPTPSPE